MFLHNTPKTKKIFLDGNICLCIKYIHQYSIYKNYTRYLLYCEKNIVYHTLNPSFKTHLEVVLLQKYTPVFWVLVFVQNCLSSLMGDDECIHG